MCRSRPGPTPLLLHGGPAPLLWSFNTPKTRNGRRVGVYRDPAVILIDQLKEIYIDGEMEVVETSIWHAKVTRKEYQVGLNLTGNGVDDPDQNFYENYKCGSERNYTGYCNPDLDNLFDKQSAELDEKSD